MAAARSCRPMCCSGSTAASGRSAAFLNSPASGRMAPSKTFLRSRSPATTAWRSRAAERSRAILRRSSTSTPSTPADSSASLGARSSSPPTIPRRDGPEEGDRGHGDVVLRPRRQDVPHRRLQDRGARRIPRRARDMAAAGNVARPLPRQDSAGSCGGVRGVDNSFHLLAAGFAARGALCATRAVSLADLAGDSGFAWSLRGASLIPLNNFLLRQFGRRHRLGLQLCPALLTHPLLCRHHARGRRAHGDLDIESAQYGCSDRFETVDATRAPASCRGFRG